MKLMPASRAFATIRDEVASSVGPPNIMVPRQIGEILRPLRPRERYCMGWVLVLIVIASEAKQSSFYAGKAGLLRRCAPLRKRFAFVAGNDGGGHYSFFSILNTPLAMAIQRFSAVTSVLTKIRLRVERATRGFDTRISPIFPL